MSKKPEKPRRKTRAIPPVSTLDHFALQRRWESVSYGDEGRYQTLEAAMTAFANAIARNPRDEWRVRGRLTLAEHRPGKPLYLHRAPDWTEDQIAALSDINPTNMRPQ